CHALFSSRGRQRVLVNCEHVRRNVRADPAWTPSVSCRQFFSPHRTRRCRFGAARGTGFLFSWPHDGAVDRLPVATFRNGAAHSPPGWHFFFAGSWAPSTLHNYL